MASAPLVLMQIGQLKIAEGMRLAATLRKELLNFKVKINIATAHDSYEAWREGDHDDLVLAVAMACWCGERYLRKRDSLPRPGIIATEGVPINAIGWGACLEVLSAYLEDPSANSSTVPSLSPGFLSIPCRGSDRLCAPISYNLRSRCAQLLHVASWRWIWAVAP